MNIKDDFIQAIDYMIQSPFVQKINGIAMPDEWGPTQTLHATGKFDNVVAKEICDSAYMLSDIKKELGAARDAITIAGQDAPELCMEALREHLGDTSAMQSELKPIQKELQELPKVDDAFMEACREKEQSLIDEREAKKRAVQENFQKSSKRKITLSVVFSVLFMLWLIGGIIGYKMELGYSSNSEFHASNLAASAGMAIIGAFGTLCSFFTGVKLLNARKKIQNTGTYPEKVEKLLEEIDESHNSMIVDVRKQMEKGYDKDSALYIKIESLKLKMALIEDAYKAKIKKTENFEAILKEPFQKAPPLLQRAIDNMDSLVAWATNYMRDKETRQHNAMMQSIEQDRLEAQEMANRKQNELLKQQADAAARQAKDTAEIKKRMQNERYGDYWKSK